MKYQLEKHRQYEYMGKEDVFETIKQSDNEQELRDIAKSIS